MAEARFTTLSRIAVCLSLWGCGSEEPTMVAFEARVGSAALACGAVYPLGTSATPAQIVDARIYVSNVRAVNAAGAERSLKLVPDGRWQTEQVALLDFENGFGACAEEGTQETRAQLLLAGGLRADETLRFTVGVPTELNHPDLQLATPPLNLGAMLWSWQAGYKFLRLDVVAESAAAPSGWLMHIGSTGCVSPAATVPPSSPCQRSNRVEVTLPAFDAATQKVVLDVARLLANQDVGANTAGTAPGCMATPDDPECIALFSQLALDPTTGACVAGCAAQKLFFAE